MEKAVHPARFHRLHRLSRLSVGGSRKMSAGGRRRQSSRRGRWEAVKVGKVASGRGAMPRFTAFAAFPGFRASDCENRRPVGDVTSLRWSTHSS